MKIGYARVSTRDQNLNLQLDALNQAGCERICQHVASGSKAARPALDELLGQIRAGDVLVCKSAPGEKGNVPFFQANGSFWGVCMFQLIPGSTPYPAKRQLPGSNQFLNV